MRVVKVPDVPTWERSGLETSATPASTDTTTVDGRDFVPRTLKTTAVVVIVSALILAQFGRFAWIAPFIGGSLLGAALLAGLEYVIRRVITADAVLEARGVIREPDADQRAIPAWKKKLGGKGAIIAFALIKYPAVGILLWWVARHLTQDRIAAFLCGFVLLQIIIGLRGLGAYLVPAKSGK